jgi:hypothetical protein
MPGDAKRDFSGPPSLWSIPPSAAVFWQYHHVATTPFYDSVNFSPYARRRIKKIHRALRSGEMLSSMLGAELQNRKNLVSSHRPFIALNPVLFPLQENV